MTSATRVPGSLTVGPLRPVILQLAAPAVAMMACHFCFNLIDSIWVGRLIGPAALAAVSTAGFYVWVLLSLGEMVEVGLIAVAARRHGEGRPDLAARAAGAAVLYALGAGTAASLLGFALTGDLFRLMTVPHEVAALGAHYLDTWLLGGPLVFGFFAIEATFRAAGDTRTPFTLLAASVLLSIGLDPLLIAGVGRFPRLGVEGAAAAARSDAGSSGSTPPTGAPYPRCSGWARRSRWPACCSPWCTCGSPGTPRASAPPRSQRSAWGTRSKGSGSSPFRASRSRPRRCSDRTWAPIRKRARARRCASPWRIVSRSPSPRPPRSSRSRAPSWRCSRPRPR